MKRRWKAALGLGLTLAALTAGEGAARLAWGPPPTTGLVRQRWDPDTKAFTLEGDQVVPAFQGSRGHGPFKRAPLQPRILVLGESSVHDGGVHPSKEIAPTLGRLLRSRGVDAEVICLGRPGLDSDDIRVILVEALAFEPDLVMVYAGHNDVGNAFMAARGGRSAAVVAALEHLWLFARLRMLAPQAGQGDEIPERPLGAQQIAALEDRFRENLHAMVEAAQGSGAPVLLATVISNLAEWKAEMPTCPEALPAGTWANGPGGLTLRGRPSPQAIEAALASHPDCPEALYLRGLARLEAGDTRAALDDLKAAQALEPVQLRATPGINAAIREVAAQTGASLVDVEAALTREGPPSPTWFVDNLHPNGEGARRIAEAALPAVMEALNQPPARQPSPL